MLRLSIVVATLWATMAAAQTCISRERLREMLPADAVVKKLDVQPTWVERTGPGIYWRRSSPVAVRAPYYALHILGLRDESGAAWRFRVKDPAGRELYGFGPEDHRAGDFWTPDLSADQLVFEVESDRKPSGLSFTIDRWLIADPKPAIRSLLVPGDSKIELIEKYRQDVVLWGVGKAVAKLTIKDADERYSCTGFLISDDVLLTNEHCIPSALPLRTPGACSEAIEALFNYVGNATPPSSYLCAEVLDKNAGLDYAVLRLAGKPGQTWGTLRLETARSPRGARTEPLRVIQHPGGRWKSVAIQRCSADHVGVPGIETGGIDQDFDHTCDTENGSSGSPVLDGAGMVVGLHHFGFAETAAVRRNQAVLMSRVVASLPADVRAVLRQ